MTFAFAGGHPVKLVEGIVLGNFDVIDGGIYYIDRVSGEAGVFFSARPGGEARLQYLRLRHTLRGDRGAQSRHCRLRSQCVLEMAARSSTRGSTRPSTN